MAKRKMTTCKYCGAEIAVSAKICPQCGGKNKPPVYKRWWFILIAVLIVSSYLTSSDDSSSGSTSSGSKVDDRVSSKINSSISTDVNSASDVAVDDAEAFAKENGISVELAVALDKIVKDTEIASSVKEIVNWKQTDDWANGERYNARIDGLYIQVSTIGDEVYCIKDTTNDRVDKFIYQDKKAGKTKEKVDSGSILISDGMLGDYGKEVITKSGYKYVQYVVPSGTYTVENKIKGATIFVVSDSNSDDVSTTLKLANVGEKQKVTIENGYHIEISYNTEIILTPVQ